MALIVSVTEIQSGYLSNRLCTCCVYNFVVWCSIIICKQLNKADGRAHVRVLLYKMSSSTRQKTAVYLIGHEEQTITGTKLPSVKQVLQVFFYHHKTLKNTIRESARSVVAETKIFWDKANIPVRSDQHLISKLKGLYDKWIKLKKSSKRRTKTQIENEQTFMSKLDNLWDIAHQDALKLIKNEEDRQFLLLQREPGRRGSMAGEDRNLSRKRKRCEEKDNILQKRKERYQEKHKTLGKVANVTISDISNSDSSSISSKDDDTDLFKAPIASTSTQTKKRAKIDIVTPKLAATLDRTKVSDRKATFVLAAAAQSLGHDIADININRSSIQRRRSIIRKLLSKQIKENFTASNFLVVHWDGKLLEDISGKETVDRLPVIVTGENVDQLLGVPKLSSGTGEAQATAVIDVLAKWNICNKISAMCFDTTSSNTGRLQGTCTILEKKLEKSLLHLACRHHIFEIILKSVYEAAMKVPTSGPDINIFKRFQAAWSSFDKTQFSTSINEDAVFSCTADVRDDVLQFCLKQLEEGSQPRSDYREFLELAVVFLGEEPTGFTFKTPGPMHHARWMAKAIYSLKIYMFKQQFKLRAAEEKGLHEVCLFLIRVYIKAWFSLTKAACAPATDLEFLANLEKLEDTLPHISRVAKKKFSNHLWYLSEELVGLAFFDETLSLELKKKMVIALKENPGTGEPEKRRKISKESVKWSEATVDQLVTQNTMSYFLKLDISTSFLEDDPSVWKENYDYARGTDMVNSLKVINDNAERGVALVEEFNKTITRKEEQFQYLLQVVHEHRKRFTNCKKDVLQQEL